MRASITNIYPVIIAALLAVAMVVSMTGCSGSKKDAEKKEKTTEEAKEVKSDKPFTDKSIDYVNGFESVSAEKVVMLTVKDADGKEKTSYEEYYIADVDLGKRSDKTEDYGKAVANENIDDKKIKTVAFNEAFGFSYEGCDTMYDFFEKAFKANNISEDINQCQFDQDIYDMSGQRTYQLNDSCVVNEVLLGDAEYDEILQETCSVTAGEADGVYYPASVSAVEQYMKDGVTYTRTLFLQLYLNKPVETKTDNDKADDNTAEVKEVPKSTPEATTETSSKENSGGCSSCGSKDMSECTSSCGCGGCSSK